MSQSETTAVTTAGQSSRCARMFFKQNLLHYNIIVALQVDIRSIIANVDGTLRLHGARAGVW